MKLSVVIVTMDRASLIDGNLASMARGHAKPDEVLVVDNSRHSDTSAVVEGWSERWPAVRYVAGGRVGVSRARNLAVEAASGDLVLITDDDCITQEECIGRIVDAFQSDPELGCLCGAVRPYGDVKGKVAVAIKTNPERGEWKGKTRPWGIGLSTNMSFRREVYLRVGGFDEEMGPGTPLYAAEDLDLIYRVLRAGGKVAYEPSIVVYHCQWRSRSQARLRRVDYARGTAAFLLKHILVGRDPYALRLAAVRLWEDVPWLALVGLAKRNLECELVSLFQLWGLLVGFWVAGRFYARKLFRGGTSPLEAKA